MTWLEAIGAVLGLINVALIIRRDSWNYPFGIAMVCVFGYVFWSARLYSDAVLQIYFLLIQFYGWANWLRARDRDHRVIVLAMDWPGRIGAVALALGVGLAIGWMMHQFTDAAAPYWDAMVAGLSVVAQFLLSRRWIENWLLWIAADVIAIGLFASRELWITAGLYAVFLGMAVAGLIAWRRARRASRAMVVA